MLRKGPSTQAMEFQVLKGLGFGLAAYDLRLVHLDPESASAFSVRRLEW